MNQERVSYYLEHYRALDPDYLAELCEKSDTLVEEASEALNTVVSDRKLDRATLLASAQEIAIETSPKKSGRWSWRIFIQLVAVGLIAVFANGFAKVAPFWLSIWVVLAFLGYWLVEWVCRKPSSRP
jgi:hypothetical protein